MADWDRLVNTVCGFKEPFYGSRYISAPNRKGPHSAFKDLFPTYQNRITEYWNMGYLGLSHRYVTSFTLCRHVSRGRLLVRFPPSSPPPSKSKYYHFRSNRRN
eukprot:1338080-Amorphochlora_amoeboformis.AAC.1